MRGEDSRGVGTGPKKRGMAQGNDAGIAENQIGGQRKEDRREDLRAQRQIVREREIGGRRDEPGQGFERPIAVAPGKSVDNRAVGHHARPNRPRGRHRRIAMVRA